MAVITSGVSCCPLCGGLLEPDDPLVATSHFVNDPFHPLLAFSDAAMHKACFLTWERRAQFVKLFNDIMASGQLGDEPKPLMQDDGEIIEPPLGEDAWTGRNERRRTALHDAAETGSVGDVLAFLRYDASGINAPDREGVTPLHLAVAWNEPDVIEALLAHGADVHARTYRRQAVIHTASIQGRPEVLEVVLAAGGDVRARTSQGQTPLHLAATTSHVAVVTALLSAGADVGVIDSDRATPLHVAASERQRDVVSVLLDAGADIDAYDVYGQTPLHKAASMRKTIGGDALTLRLLLKRGADIDAKDAAGRTPREVAMATGHWMARRLIDQTEKDRAGADAIRGVEG